MIGIINYGLGNIKAFENIYRKLHIPVKILHEKEDFIGINKLILPGVGAFDHAMTLFNNSGMREITEKMVVQEKIPVIGICVGMQMLANSSEEGNLKGLGWVDAVVKKFDVSRIATATRLPHMGWNDVEPCKENRLLTGLYDKAKFYFLHSYFFECKSKEDIIATSEYGYNFSCAINKDNIFGVQFHPEKSHQFGIRLLENFSKI
jgi:glutamine amidotransferase